MKIANKILILLIFLNIALLICFLVKNQKINNAINELNSVVYMVEE